MALTPNWSHQFAQHSPSNVVKRTLTAHDSTCDRLKWSEKCILNVPNSPYMRPPVPMWSFGYFAMTTQHKWRIIHAHKVHGTRGVAVMLCMLSALRTSDRGDFWGSIR